MRGKVVEHGEAVVLVAVVSNKVDCHISLIGGDRIELAATELAKTRSTDAVTVEKFHEVIRTAKMKLTYRHGSR